MVVLKHKNMKKINRLQLVVLILETIAIILLFVLIFSIGVKFGIDSKDSITITTHDTVYVVKSKTELPNLNIKQFKNIIAELESKNNYEATSKNYFGKYQISQTNIALSDYDVDVFMEDKEVQEWVMDDLFYEYLYHTVSYCNKYNGTCVFNLDIDTWTILYGCHCIGYPKIKKWLDKPVKNRLYYQMLNFNSKRNEKS
jgi:hypothetical protein